VRVDLLECVTLTGVTYGNVVIQLGGLGARSNKTYQERKGSSSTGPGDCNIVALDRGCITERKCRGLCVCACEHPQCCEPEQASRTHQRHGYGADKQVLMVRSAHDQRSRAQKWSYGNRALEGGILRLRLGLSWNLWPCTWELNCTAFANQLHFFWTPNYSRVALTLAGL
jgi:hypothetical protein